MDRPKRPTPKLASKAELETQAERYEAERLGRVAAHFLRPASSCPYVEDDPRRSLWLDHYEKVSKTKGRLDMPRAKAEGFRAFQDGLTENECRFPMTSPERSEWRAGWDDAKRARDKRDENLR